MKTVSSRKLKHRPPAAKPTRLNGPSAHLIGSLRGKIRVTGDILATDRKWNAQS
ncbi:MAG TPA: hypothetical protein VGN88_03750 [Phycisphaerae bacterium]|jgi:hypothetical protein